MKNLYLLILSFLFIPDIRAISEIESLLPLLDKAIAQRETYNQEYEIKLHSIKELIGFSDSNDQLFSLYNRLFEGYRQFNNDSCLYYANKKKEIATLTGNPIQLTEVELNFAEVMITAGMYKDAARVLEQTDAQALPQSLYEHYYHLCRKLYGLIANHSVTTKEIDFYSKLTDTYRDTLMMIYPPSSSTYHLVKADKDIVAGKSQEALNDLLSHFKEIELYSHTSALYAYSIAEACLLLGEKEQAKEYYAISAISDLHCGIREYVSLYRLAELLFQDGDINRSYNYLKCSLEDASKCNARIRTIEISQFFPIIEGGYQDKEIARKKMTYLFLAAVSLLALCLLIALFLIYRQMKKTNRARQEVQEANERLQILNMELKDSNWQLKEFNHTLSETNHIKEEYIARYMDQCAEYLEKMDTYRKSLNKLAAAGNLAELYKMLKSEQQIEDERKEFYANFDDTFLSLFPSFVDEFNALLTDKIILKGDERLNTELRIFALIRLGVTDSNKIAQFLRYSLRTIYNYRVRIRNKAIGKRDDFENKVMRIGRIADL